MSGAQLAKRQGWYRNLRQRPGKGSLRVREAPTRLAEEVKSYGIGSKNGPVTGATVARAAPLAAYAVPAIAAVGLASVGLSYAATERANLAGGIRGVKRGRVVEAADLTAEDRAIIALANKPKSQLAPPAAFNVKESQDGDAPEGFFSRAGSAIMRMLPVASAAKVSVITPALQAEWDELGIDQKESMWRKYRDASVKDPTDELLNEQGLELGKMYMAAKNEYVAKKEESEKDADDWADYKANSKSFDETYEDYIKRRDAEKAAEEATKDYESRWAPKGDPKKRNDMPRPDDEGEVVMGGMGGNTTNTTSTTPAPTPYQKPTKDDYQMAQDTLREMKRAIEAEVKANPLMSQSRLTELQKQINDAAAPLTGGVLGDAVMMGEMPRMDKPKEVTDLLALLHPREKELSSMSASASGTDFLGFPTAEKDVVKNQQERMSALRPFLPHAGTEVFDEQETAEADARKIQNLTMGMSKPLNFPLGNVSNKFWLQNVAREGMLLSDPLYDMPVIYQGSTLNEGATLYGVEEMVPDVRGVEQGVVQNRFHKAQSLLSPAWNSGRRLRKTM